MKAVRSTKLREVLLGAGAVMALWMFERAFPLRSPTQPYVRRQVRNLLVAATAAASLALIERPVVAPLAAKVSRRHLGLLGTCKLAPGIRTAMALVLMDYTLFVWHYLTHRLPFLWKFHLPHHVDLDMDASTALRFHFGELALSTVWRAGQVRLIGVTPRDLKLWQTLTTISILFHHSNLRLPQRLDSLLSVFIVTPRVHDVHHSRVDGETNSNWSSGLRVWDWLHGTRGLQRTSDRLGVDGFDKDEQVTLAKLMRMPWTHRS